MKGVRSFVTVDEKNDLFYVCALIEFIARETTNKRGDIVRAIERAAETVEGRRC